MEHSEVLLGTPLENIMGDIIKNIWDLHKEKKFPSSPQLVG
jgi:hypothetical protein